MNCSRIVSRLTRRGRNSSSTSQQRRRRILRPRRLYSKDGKSLADFIETSTRPAISCEISQRKVVFNSNVRMSDEYK